MDAYGIGAALQGAARIYFQSARRTGRTTALLESLKDGDRVIFSDSREADRVGRLARELGVKIQCLVIDPKDPRRLFERGTSEGRTIFDHSWVEAWYMQALQGASMELDHLQRESSGWGVAHAETRLAAREVDRWR